METDKEKLTLTDKQKEIVSKMRNGWDMFITQSEYNGRTYYGITKGFDNEYFNATVFSNLIQKDLIYQEPRHNEYVLTELGETIKI